MTLEEARITLMETELNLSGISTNSVYSGSYEMTIKDAQRLHDALMTMRIETEGMYSDFSQLADRIHDAIIRNSYEIAEGLAESTVEVLRDELKSDDGR